MEWLPGAAAIAAVLIGIYAAFSWLARCRHPNPHYRRAVTQQNPVTGSHEVVEPASYICYDCGRTWPAEVRDPAWAPSGIRQTFAGYDEALAERAATRAAIVGEQRQLLAANRTGPTRGEPVGKKRARRGKWRAANVTDINTRRPA
jgi:hypothetical protein